MLAEDWTHVHTEDELFRNLFGRYSKWTRPARNVTDVVIIKFGLSIAQLIDVVQYNQQTHTVHTLMFFLYCMSTCLPKPAPLQLLFVTFGPLGWEEPDDDNQRVAETGVIYIC